jgi:hypothetical protein
MAGNRLVVIAWLMALPINWTWRNVQVVGVHAKQQQIVSKLLSFQ